MSVDKMKSIIKKCVTFNGNLNSVEKDTVESRSVVFEGDGENKR